MQVGLLGGTGPAGRALAVRLASVGVDVLLGSRSEERAAETCAELVDRWGERVLTLQPAVNAAAADAPLVVVATPWDAAASTAASHAGALAGKTVISMANAVGKLGDELQALIPVRGSVAAGVQAALPQSMVAAAFQHLPARELGDLDRQVDGDVLVCSDHPDAKAAACELVGMIPGLRALDAGSLAAAAPIEAFTAVLVNLNIRYRTRAALRITGIGEA